MTRALLLIVTLLTVVFFGTTPLRAQATAAESPAAVSCAKMTAADYSRVTDAPTQVTSAAWVAASAVVPAHCQVLGYVSPNIGIEMRLPDQWNGKFSHVGCGGFCGNTFGLGGCAGLLTRGYACIMSDMGHRSTALDGKWAYNNLQAKFDFGVRATHVATLAGKAITSTFYGKAPSLSYYLGCSTGGRQGMFEAQRFPNDFDGIVAGAPVLNETGDGMVLLWNTMSTLDKNGRQLFTFGDIRRLHAAVIGACDMNDGVKDGLIGDGRACRFDPDVLACRGNTGEASCFTADQVRALRKIYSGPTNSKGQPVYAASALPGSELNWIGNYVGENGNPSTYSKFIGDLFRYLSFMPDPGPLWQPGDFDWDRDPDRRNVMEVLYSAENPDLRRFKASGGKLLVYHGWADQSVLTQPVIDYYEATTRVMGGSENTRDFFRLFHVPGMNHCTGGEGAYRVDYLTAIENWVERGQAPRVLIGQHPAADAPNGGNGYGAMPLPASQVAFSRPHFAYPEEAHYRGGDVRLADSFVARTPPSR